LSGFTSNSTTSAVRNVVEQSDPPVPHSMPGPMMVPFAGFVIVRTWPAGKSQ
jgi:hypothetical protein